MKSDTLTAFELFVEQFAKPAILELAQEAEQPVSVTVREVSNSETIRMAVVPIDLDKCDGDLASGEVRVSFKGQESDFRFSAQSIIEGLAEGTGFSGFSARGKCRLENGGTVKVSARTNRYNVWAWESEFQIEEPSPPSLSPPPSSPSSPGTT